jgi:hypothetical protein
LLAVIFESPILPLMTMVSHDVELMPMR